MQVVVVTNVTLDGVVQGPGSPDEDRRGGFTLGGWAPPYFDEVMGAEMGAGMAGTTEDEGAGGMLFGRRTYEQFASYWPHQPDSNPFAAVLNGATKYVASRTLAEPLDWAGSVLLEGDAATSVARLKAQPGRALTVLGSVELAGSLLAAGLVDELVLSIHPLALGAGLRLLPDGGGPVRFELRTCTPTTTGVLIARYAPVGAAG